MRKENYIASGRNDPIPNPDSYPSWVTSGDGAFVADEDGTEYLDLWMGFGGLLFGHGDEEIADAIADRADEGWFFSYPTELERDLSQRLHEAIPCAERVRFATSGSDAVAYAIRAARAHTGRDDVLTIEGGYHGVHEGLMDSGGVPDDRKSGLSFVPFNDAESLRRELESESYAAFVLEPVLANAGCVPPEDEYLETVREVCSETGTVLVFDEVVTGFRLGPGGAQERFDVVPDLSTFSKAIGNGMPLSAVCGRTGILDEFEPSGDVMFAGTFNGHPLSLVAAKTVLDRIEGEEVLETADRLGRRFREFVADELADRDLRATVQGVGSMATVSFGVDEFPHGLAVQKPDRERYRAFVDAAADEGLLLPPLATETMFFSPAHEPHMDDIESAVVTALDEVEESQF